MDKLQMIVNNAVTDNIKKIASLFPHCVTEITDAKGQSKIAVDFDKLRQELSTEVIEGKCERFEFVWPDKKKSHSSCQFSYYSSFTPRPQSK